VYKTKYEVQMHFVSKGFDENFVKEKGNAEPWNDDRDLNIGPTNDARAANNLVSALFRGASSGNNNEEPNESAKKFFDLLKDVQQELYPGCSQLTKVSFMVRLFQLRCMGGSSNHSAGQALSLFSDALPPGHCIPDTIEKARKMIRDLGLTYIKIHACVNDCLLFHGRFANMDMCPTCGESRCKKDPKSDEIGESSESGGAKKRISCKVLGYFPLISRLQRLYMSEETSSLMRWHMEELVRDGKMRHPADSLAW
jgi:hypothetical protein